MHLSTYHASAVSAITRPRTLLDQALGTVLVQQPLTRNLFSQSETEALVAQVSRAPNAIEVMREINVTEASTNLPQVYA